MKWANGWFRPGLAREFRLTDRQMLGIGFFVAGAFLFVGLVFRGLGL